MVDINLKVVKPIPDGSHKGKLLRIEDSKITDKQPFEYINFVIELEEYEEIEIIKSNPAKLSIDEDGNPKSKLAEDLLNLGVSLDFTMNTEKLNNTLSGMPIECMTITKKTEKGEFARIVDGSLKKA
jgi:hypothetical protein